MDPQPNSISHRLRLYFRNSPKRIAIAWIIVHIIVFTLGVLWLLLIAGYHLFSALMTIVWLFPGFWILLTLSDVLEKIFNLLFVDLKSIHVEVALCLYALLYYGSFIRLCFITRDTTSRRFRFWHRFCITLFTLSVLIAIFFAVFVTITILSPSTEPNW